MPAGKLLTEEEQKMRPNFVPQTAKAIHLTYGLLASIK